MSVEWPTLNKYETNKQIDTKNYWKKKKRLCVRLRSGDKHHLRKPADEKHKSGRRSFRSPDWFVLFDLQIFSGGVYPPCHSHPFPVPPCTRNPPIHPRKSYSTLRMHVFSTLLFWVRFSFFVILLELALIDSLFFDQVEEDRYTPSATSRTISFSISNIVFILVCMSDLNLLFLADYWTGWFLSKNAKCKKVSSSSFFQATTTRSLIYFPVFLLHLLSFSLKLLLLKHSVACLFVENSIFVGLLCASMGAVRIAKFNGRHFGCHRG